MPSEPTCHVLQPTVISSLNSRRHLWGLVHARLDFRHRHILCLPNAWPNVTPQRMSLPSIRSAVETCAGSS